MNFRGGAVQCDSAPPVGHFLYWNKLLSPPYSLIFGQGACFRDSGGSLVCNENGKAILVGVTSYGGGDYCGAVPTAYARVTHVLKWIKETLVGLSNFALFSCSNPFDIIIK